MFEIDIMGKDNNSRTTAILNDSVIVLKKRYGNRCYGIMNIRLEDKRSSIIGRENAAQNLCSKCLSQIAIDEQGNILANYVIVDYRSRELYAVPDTDILSEKAVGDYLIFAENEKNNIRLIIVYSLVE